MAPLEPYSIRFFWGNVLSNASSATYSVPQGFSLVLTDIEAWQAPASNNFVRLNLMPENGPVIELGHNSVTSHAQWTGRLVLPYGTGFSVVAFNSAAWVAVSGYQLTVVST